MKLSSYLEYINHCRTGHEVTDPSSKLFLISKYDSSNLVTGFRKKKNKNEMHDMSVGCGVHFGSDLISFNMQENQAVEHSFWNYLDKYEGQWLTPVVVASDSSAEVFWKALRYLLGQFTTTADLPVDKVVVSDGLLQWLLPLLKEDSDVDTELGRYTINVDEPSMIREGLIGRFSSSTLLLRKMNERKLLALPPAPFFGVHWENDYGAAYAHNALFGSLSIID